MDNYNNQGQQFNTYMNGQAPQGNYNNSQPQYNPYMNNQPQYNTYGNMGYQAYSNDISSETTGIKGFISASMILGLLGSIIMFIGLMLPAIDFSHFHQEVDIQYNLFKVGKNVGLISGMWNIIPYAILVSIILLVILSFVRIPVLKILPVVLILCMFVLMLVDMGNVAAWATDLLDKVGIVLETDITTGEIFKSLMPGIYIMVVGLMVSLISCFVKIKE
ncbi:MAG: hypothetical protein IKJ73_01650 [Lachnospiraceae bacterium]|nr:hypothetical protein [Lachnospiraceae bacterium]